jgi:hypothetical protein
MTFRRRPLLPGSAAARPETTETPEFIDGELPQWRYPTDGDTPCEERYVCTASGDSSGGHIDSDDSPSGRLSARHFGRSV